jgi:type I restriction enzyme R subunit
MNQFSFLQPEFPSIYEAADRAITAVHPDPRTACFYARRALELTVNWLYQYDDALTLPYQENLSALVHEPSFKRLVGEALFTKARLMIKIGNHAVHQNRAVPTNDAIVAVKELFHITYWLAHTYGRKAKPESGLTFNPATIPQTPPVPKQTIEQLQKLTATLQERDEKLSTILAAKNDLDTELHRLRAELAQVKLANSQQPDTHDYSEAETRDYFIDLLLKEAGWSLDSPRDREFPVTGMPNKSGDGFVDYVLWGNDGKPLAVVEAKRTKHDPRIGQQQARLYADCLEAQFKQRPLIFYSNGYTHWLWDDLNYPPRQVQGFYKQAELELLIQRRTTRKSLAEATINTNIAGRYYQTRAIRRISETFERDKDRKSLIVMATGAGKTRVAISLVDLLIRCNWVKRVLFLADRKALVSQAVNVFKKHLPDAAPVNLVTEKNTEGRVYASTYPTMMGLIDDTKDGRRFSPGHFDLIIIDEAHRSVFQKYRAIFNYFDALLLGLTATPKDEIDRNTYGLFELEDGVPTDAYSLEDAVKDGFLVPPQAVSVPLKFQQEGINYHELSETEREQWELLEWEEDEDGNIPERVDAGAINNWLFNIDTVDKVLAHLMTRGLKVAGGDRLGKTIIFAKNQAHANFIADRFDLNYPHLKGEFARVITFKTTYAQNLIDTFSIPNKPPHIAISVDMLDTGIDVPEVVNLVLFKTVRSKSKFWQMVGRGTRLSEDLFSPGQDKQFFYLFDYCQNLEFFQHSPATTNGSVGKSLSKRLFTARLALIGELDRVPDRSEPEIQIADDEPKTNIQVRDRLTNLLQTEIEAMNVDNFVVRPQRQLVEKYAKPEIWNSLSEAELLELSQTVAGLPSQLPSEPEEAKRFDLLILSLQLAVLKSAPTIDRLREQVRSIAESLAAQATIPLVNAQLSLLEDLQTDDWWQDVTIPMLETVRKRLRDLVKLMPKLQRQPIYTDFEDELGAETTFELPGVISADRFEQFRIKARAFLRSQPDNIAIFKLRTNKQLTPTDLVELERILAESGVGDAQDLDRAKTDASGLGVFVRSLVGLDREVAKQELAGFLDRQQFNANQIEFIDTIVNYLTEHGVMDAALLYESPLTDITPQGPDGLFTSSQVDELVAVLAGVYTKAIA